MPFRRPTPLGIAVREILGHRLRTVLVAQGMIWGVALSIAPVAVIEGSRAQAVHRAREMGLDVVTASPAREVTLGETAIPRESDLEPLRAALGPEAELTAFRWARGQIPELPGGAWVYGVDDGIASLRNVTVLAGELAELDPVRSTKNEIPAMIEWTLGRRLLGDASDEPLPEAARAQVADQLVGAAIVMTQIPDRKARGAMIPLRLYPSGEALPRVSGADVLLRIEAVVSDQVLRQWDALGNEKGRSTTKLIAQLVQLAGVTSDPAPWLSEGLGLYVPRRLIPGADLDWIMIRADPSRVREVIDTTERLLVDRGRAVLVRSNAVLPALVSPELDGYLAIRTVFKWVFLLVGGLSMMNIMLLVGHRRRREIALRRAEGARRLDIFLQFLCEGKAIALVGLVFGTMAGMLIAVVRVWIDPNAIFAVTVPWFDVFESWAALVVVALIACSIPAWRATRFHPAELLRESR